MIRVDDRLLHGQVIWGWINTGNYKKILVITNSLNEEWVEIAKQIVPNEITVLFYSKDTPEILDILKEADQYTFILIDKLETLFSLYSKKFTPREVIIGGIHPEKKAINTKISFANLTEKDINLLKEMSRDINFYFQDIRENPKIPLNKIISL